MVRRRSLLLFRLFDVSTERRFVSYICVCGRPCLCSVCCMSRPSSDAVFVPVVLPLYRVLRLVVLLLAAAVHLGRAGDGGSLEPSWLAEDFPTANPAAMKAALASVGLGPDGKFAASRANDGNPHSMLRFAKGTSGDKALGLKGGGNCFGLVNKQCDPCPPPEQNSAGHAGKCDLLKDQCNNLFCDPLCLKTLPDCEVGDVPPPFQEASSPAVAAGLCAELRAQTCVVGGCCAKDDMLQQWVEEFAFGATYPASPMKIQACRHNAGDKVASAKLCADCKAAMAGKITAVPYPKNHVCTNLEAFFPEFGHDPEASSGNQWTPYNYKFGFPGIGPHKPFKERCEHLHDALVSALAHQSSDFSANNACHCMGCCDNQEQCHFPIGQTV